MSRLTVFAIGLCVLHVGQVVVTARGEDSQATLPSVDVPGLPDAELVEAYRHAATDNVLAAVNPRVFPGYFSVCADGQGFGYGNSYPSLDGHQMSAALLWLNQVDVVRQNWDFVRGFQQPNGRLPLAILPALAGQPIGAADAQSTVDANGGLYVHWVPGNPLAALASPTFIQNADVIYRHTLDQSWLAANIAAVNLSADYLATLMTADGTVQGGGYYVERPARIASDGVAQCHAVDAFRRVAALNRVLGHEPAAARYEQLAARVASRFTTAFWAETHFAEYLHPTRGFITRHGLTDVDWAALATQTASPQQCEVLWPQLRAATAFYYGGMPTGISTQPATYEDWEFTHPDRHDLAAMGRVWYLECWARSRYGDAVGLLDTLKRVAREGRAHDYSWRERYYPSDTGTPIPAGAEKYCEYPANFLRIVNQFLLGIDLRLDGTVAVSPTVTDEFWDSGFGHILHLRTGTIEFRLQRDALKVVYTGPSALRLGVKFPPAREHASWVSTKKSAECSLREEAVGWLWLDLPPSSPDSPCRIELSRAVKKSG